MTGEDILIVAVAFVVVLALMVGGFFLWLSTPEHPLRAARRSASTWLGNLVRRCPHNWVLVDKREAPGPMRRATRTSGPLEHHVVCTYRCANCGRVKVEEGV